MVSILLDKSFPSADKIPQIEISLACYFHNHSKTQCKYLFLKIFLSILIKQLLWDFLTLKELSRILYAKISTFQAKIRQL